MHRPSGRTFAFTTIVVSSLALATLAGSMGTQFDNSAYDWMFRRHLPPLAQPQTILLAIDEPTLNSMGGMRRIRKTIAAGLERIAPVSPKVVAVDLILSDEGDPADDAALESTFKRIPRLVLACDIIDEGKAWEDPLPRFRSGAASLGHVHADPGPADSINRAVPLEKVAGRERRWALSLEAYRLASGAGSVLESPEDLEIAGLRIPCKRTDSRSMRIRYFPPGPEGRSALPRISFRDLEARPELAEQFRDKIVFVGVTAQSAMRDRLMTPFTALDGMVMPGVEIHASAFETVAQRQFIVSTPAVTSTAFSVVLALGGVLAFALLSGWQAYAVALLVLLAAHLVPYVLFTQNIVLPYFAPAASAWLASIGAGTYQFVAVRRQLRKTESEKTRYQQAMHFVTHEMRTPLTAIQGSSELIGRYNLTDEKRKQIAGVINSESKRLAKMVETFLNVERLSAGQMQLKMESMIAGEVVSVCVQRAAPVAERKQIGVHLGEVPEAALTGDRELLEYAVYNLLTNAVKYSPPETQIQIAVRMEGDQLFISVRDQGIGMDEHELRNIFQKFYRTTKAVASGEAGTGIGLSIVDQIVTHHGGRIEVTSAPGKGSCFTLVLPVEKMVSRK